MEGSILTILAWGFILGIKHAIEPDHVIAVTAIAGRSKKLSRSSLSGVYWGIGHTATLFIVGIIFIVLKGEISEKWALSLEFLVGMMLVYLGISAIGFFKSMRDREHEHAEASSNLKSVIIGFVHGLAGSGAMILLTMSMVDNVWEGAGYIFIFGAGTVIGMLIFTTLIGIPFVLSSKKRSLNRVLTRMTGVISLAFGIYYMYNLGITEGLFRLWIRQF